MNPDANQLQQIKSERTLVLLKPDAVSRHIVGEIIQRFERKNMKIVGIKTVSYTHLTLPTTPYV